MKDECLICSAPLEYLETDEMMECSICHKQENSKTRCVKGHYVCNECHTAGMDSIIGLCLKETSKNPIEIMEKLMGQPFCHMHGPEHHVMVGSVLLTAYKNAGGDIDLHQALLEMMSRGKSVPGGACGFWGACGAGISSGMFVSIISKSTPLTVEPFGRSNLMTAKALEKIGTVGGPRCCKRDSYLSILAAIDFVKEHLGIEMDSKETYATTRHKTISASGVDAHFLKQTIEIDFNLSGDSHMMMAIPSIISAKKVRKIGSGNWIVDNLNSALATWNGKLAEIWPLLSTRPEDFKGGGVWSVILNIHGGLQAIGYALLVLFFVMGVVKTMGSFAEVNHS